MSYNEWVILENDSVNCSSSFLELFKLANSEAIKILYQKPVAFAILLGVFPAILFHWFHRNRLRYLLRFSCAVFVFASLLNFLCRNDGRCKNCIANFCNGSAIQWSLAASTFFIVIMIIIRYNWGLPVNFVKVSDEGRCYNHCTMKKRMKCTMQDHSDQMLPVFPNGWFPLVESNQLTAGNVIAIPALGQKFCVFRGVTGQAYILDSCCPHLGADLTTGRVSGDCIRCPFHGMEFQGKDGRCVKAPYFEKVPDVTKVKTWRSCEVNGFIFVWYHAEKEEPNWEVLPVEAIGSGEWKYRGRLEQTTYCHIQDIVENGTDLEHLHYVHSASVFLGMNWMTNAFYSDFLKHQFHSDWKQDDTMPHMSKLEVSHGIQLYGYNIPFIHLKANIYQMGPGTAQMFLETWFGKGIFFLNTIPEEPYKQRIVHHFYTEKRFKPLPAAIYVLMHYIMIARDVIVWDKKRVLSNPVLMKEDKSIHKFRRWYSQFYTKHSPTLKDIHERNLDW